MPVLLVTADRRRSQRILWSVPLIIESLEPTVYFDGRCITVDVSLHGCQFYLPRPLKNGTPVRLVIRNAGQPAGVGGGVAGVREQKGWVLAGFDRARGRWRVCVEFAQPGNVWGIQSPPADWLAAPSVVPSVETALH